MNQNLSPAGRRAALNGNVNIQINRHRAYFGGARDDGRRQVQFRGAPGFVREYPSLGAAAGGVIRHNDEVTRVVCSDRYAHNRYLDKHIAADSLAYAAGRQAA